MKRRISIRGLAVALAVMMMTGLFSCPALADDAGVLTEAELGAWVTAVLRETAGLQPQNAPVGEESLTENGYAFLYPFATLYYDKPVLDAQSVLQGFSITAEAFDTPRGIRLGAPGEMLISAYGWQNPSLLGDGGLAAFYVLNQLPKGAYWAWAQCAEGQLTAVQCAVHAAAGTNAYTDAGIRYQVEDGAVAAIVVYGLSQLISQADVSSNLSAVYGVQAAISGDEAGEMDAPVAVQGVTQKSGEAEFGLGDLRFSKIDFLTLTEEGAKAAFGEPLSENWVEDGAEWMRVVQREGVSLTYAADANRQNSRLEILSFTGQREGPRGVKVGDPLDGVMARFRCDGTGETKGSEALLYGDGTTAPYGALTVTGDTATLRYGAQVAGADGQPREIGLYLTFQGQTLTEIMLYSW